MPHIALAIAAVGSLLIGCNEGSRSPQPKSRVFVSNETAGTVSVIDARTDTIIATIPVGKRPRGLRVSPDGKTLFVALSGSPRGGPGVDESTLPPPDRAADGIGVIDLEQLALVRTLESGPDPESFDIVDRGKTLVVSNEDVGEASFIDVKTGKVRAKVAVGREPEGVTTAPDGSKVYVTSEGDARVTVINPVARRVVSAIPTGNRPRSVVFSADGRTALVTNENDGTLTVIDAATSTVVDTIVLPKDPSATLGPRPMGIARSLDGKTAYVTTGRAGSLAIIDLPGRKVARTIPGVGARPWGVAVDATGRVWTANGPSNDVSVLDPRTGKVVKRIPVGAGPWGIASQP